MQNKNQILDPMTCELQVGDVVEVLKVPGVYGGEGEICTIIEIDNLKKPFLIENKKIMNWVERNMLRLISRNGKPVEVEQHVEESKQKTENRVFVNVYDNGNGRFLSHDYASFDEAYENRADISTYIETVEIVRNEKPTPKIDFGKAGLMLTDGEILVITAGEQGASYFKAFCIFQSKYFDSCAYNKHNGWRDITAEAMPIVEQLKHLMK